MSFSNISAPQITSVQLKPTYVRCSDTKQPTVQRFDNQQYKITIPLSKVESEGGRKDYYSHNLQPSDLREVLIDIKNELTSEGFNLKNFEIRGGIGKGQFENRTELLKDARAQVVINYLAKDNGISIPLLGIFRFGEDISSFGAEINKSVRSLERMSDFLTKSTQNKVVTVSTIQGVDQPFTDNRELSQNVKITYDPSFYKEDINLGKSFLQGQKEQLIKLLNIDGYDDLSKIKMKVDGLCSFDELKDKGEMNISITYSYDENTPAEESINSQSPQLFNDLSQLQIDIKESLNGDPVIEQERLENEEKMRIASASLLATVLM